MNWTNNYRRKSRYAMKSPIARGPSKEAKSCAQSASTESESSATIATPTSSMIASSAAVHGRNMKSLARWQETYDRVVALVYGCNDWQHHWRLIISLCYNAKSKALVSVT